MEPRVLRYGSWTGTIAPLVIWMTYFIVVYAAVSVGCIAGFANTHAFGINAITLVLALITALAALGIAAFGWVGLRGWRVSRGSDLKSERVRFAGAVTVLIALLALIATAWVGLPIVMLHPCQ
jgi:hypothetical protein